tara:strand:+ start:4572 stop:5141 length:570 start_codon:yes stop_codon:yes gene_type:complete
MELKTCVKCGEAKPKGEFYKDSASPSGRHCYCKVCKRAWSSKNWREYYDKNKKKITKYKKVWGRERRRDDPTFKLTANMRTSMWRVLKGISIGQLVKGSRTFSYIDKSPEELMNYLEAKFTEGMSRENYGEWHVDHVRPIASFEFDKHKEGSAEFEALLGEAWHYTNLQPLWASDNASKGAKWGPVEED